MDARLSDLGPPDDKVFRGGAEYSCAAPVPSVQFPTRPLELGGRTEGARVPPRVEASVRCEVRQGIHRIQVSAMPQPGDDTSCDLRNQRALLEDFSSMHVREVHFNHRLLKDL
jgi:hypothetical protein